MRFILVDRVLEFVADQYVETIKNVSMDADYLEHHFPSFPLLPGVLIIEAMAQSSGYFLGRSARELEGRRVLPLLNGVRAARFLHVVRPGDQLRIRCTCLERRPMIGRTRVEARVGERVVSRAELSLIMASTTEFPELEAQADLFDQQRAVLEGAMPEFLKREESA